MLLASFARQQQTTPLFFEKIRRTFILYAFRNFRRGFQLKNHFISFVDLDFSITNRSLGFSVVFEDVSSKTTENPKEPRTSQDQYSRGN